MNKKKNNKLYLVILNSLVFVIVIVAIWLIATEYLHLNDKTYVNDAQVKAYINPINSRVPGYVSDIYFKEHQAVKKGDTLLVLDSSDFKNAIAQAEAVLSQALASKLAAQSSISRVGSSELTVDANLLGMQAQLENAQTDLVRYKNLLDNKAVTLQQYQLVETKFKTLQANYQAMLKQKKTAKLATNETESQLAIIDAQIDAAKAALERAHLNLKYAHILAPEDGVMGRKKITTGQFIQPGQQIASLVQQQSKWVEANLLEKQMDLIKVGDTLEFTIDGMGDARFEGYISSISAATGSEYAAIPTDNSAGNFVKVQKRIPVKIEFTKDNNPENLDKVRVGMNVVMTLEN